MEVHGRAEVEQVDEEVVRQRARGVGEHAERRAVVVRPEDPQAADEDGHLRVRSG